MTTPAPLPAELQTAVDNPLPGIRVAAVGELVKVLRGNHAGRAIGARQALEQLTRDVSSIVAAAATTALGDLGPARQPEPQRPELAVSSTDINLGRFPQHGRSPEYRIRIRNAGGGDLNARATASARWLRLRHADDELAVTVDTNEAGDYHETITIDSDGGTATIRVHAQVDPVPSVKAPGTGQAADQHALQGLAPALAARQAGEKFGLGELLKVSVVRDRDTRLTGLGKDLRALSVAGALLSLVVTPWVLAGLAEAVFATAGAVFAAACVVIVIGRRKRPVRGWLARYQDGFAQLLLPGNLRVVRWAGVTEVGVTFRIVRSGGTMNVAPSTSAAVSGFYARPCRTKFAPQTTGTSVAKGDAAALAADALRAVGPRLTAALVAAYDAGEAATFGQVRIDQSGITFPAREGLPASLVQWSGISSVTGLSIALPGQSKLVYEVNLHCESKPKYRSIGLNAVPNGIFLPAVLRHAATTQGIPARL